MLSAGPPHVLSQIYLYYYIVQQRRQFTITNLFFPLTFSLLVQTYYSKLLAAMESPQLANNTTTDSISSQLYGTHIKTPANLAMVFKGATSTVYLALYSEHQFIQLSISLATASAELPLLVLRRVEDSYINISQMLHVLVVLNYFSVEQVRAFINNEVISNPQYLPVQNGLIAPLYTDLSLEKLPEVRGVWVPYDKAVSIAVKFDLYKLLRKLFLVDVHDYDKLPKFDTASASSPRVTAKRSPENAPEESPTKKRKPSLAMLPPVSVKPLTHAMLEAALASNPNSPSLIPPVVPDDNNREIVSKVKAQFSEIFKSDGKGSFLFTLEEISTRFAPIFEKCTAANINSLSVLDIPLDLMGRTALHYAATLASANLVSSFIELKLCSPVRGDNNGESALVASIQVTNSMEKGNFSTMLNDWLWPCLWLFDNKHQSILHHLILVGVNNFKSAKFYLSKILEWVISNADKTKNLFSLCEKVINAKENQDGSTALHWAGNNEMKWFVFLLLELNADPEVPNKLGVKPIDFDCVKQVSAIRSKYKQNLSSSQATKLLLEELDADDDSDEFLLLLVQTGVEFLAKLSPFRSVGVLEEIPESASNDNTKQELNSSASHSSKISNSIQELLASTNQEFEKVINAKKAEINNLNNELRDATILTANNRFVIKKVAEKINSIDSLKLQLANVNEKLQMLNSEGANGDNQISTQEDGKEVEVFDADAPFIIQPIYEKLMNNETVEATPELLESLPSVNTLKAQLAAYEELNSNLEKEAECLLDYSALTSKFKKVVSFCTGVNVEEVDDLLDGLLEAVEGQQ